VQLFVRQLVLMNLGGVVMKLVEGNGVAFALRSWRA